MANITTQLKARFRFTTKLLRSYERKAAGLRIGGDDHRRAMERVFEIEDSLFELIAIMSTVEQSEPTTTG